MNAPQNMNMGRRMYDSTMKAGKKALQYAAVTTGSALLSLGFGMAAEQSNSVAQTTPLAICDTLNQGITQVVEYKAGSLDKGKGYQEQLTALQCSYGAKDITKITLTAQDGKVVSISKKKFDNTGTNSLGEEQTYSLTDPLAPKKEHNLDAHFMKYRDGFLKAWTPRPADIDGTGLNKVRTGIRGNTHLDGVPVSYVVKDINGNKIPDKLVISLSGSDRWDNPREELGLSKNVVDISDQEKKGSLPRKFVAAGKANLTNTIDKAVRDAEGLFK